MGHYDDCRGEIDPKKIQEARERREHKDKILKQFCKKLGIKREDLKIIREILEENRW